MSPGSRRGSGSATRAAMTKAKSSAELTPESLDSSRTSRLIGISAGGKQGTIGGAGAVTPSPSGSPSELRAQTLNYAPQIPEPPDTPPPLAPAIAHPGYGYPAPPGTASSCSSTPSIPELQYPSIPGQPRPHVQVDFTSTRSSHSHSPEQNYASPAHSHGGSGDFQSPTDPTAAWVYSGHGAQYQQQYLSHQQVLHQHQRAKSVSPTHRTQPAQSHATSAPYGYDYSENYQLQYPDTPAIHSAEYAQPVSTSSRQTVPHISPSRPPMSMLSSEGASGYTGAGTRYDSPTPALLTRYMTNDTGAPVAGPSAHHGHTSQGSLVQSYPPAAPGAVVESPRNMYAYANNQSPHRYSEPQASEDATSAYYASGYGGAGAGRSSPRTLPPIQTARIVRDDPQQPQAQPQPPHAQPPSASALDAAHQQAPYAYSASYQQQQPQPQPQQPQHMSSEHAHPQAQAPDRASAPVDVPLHQPRPHYSPQQYGAFYAPSGAAATAATPGGGYYRRSSHDHVVAR